VGTFIVHVSLLDRRVVGEVTRRSPALCGLTVTVLPGEFSCLYFSFETPANVYLLFSFKKIGFNYFFFEQFLGLQKHWVESTACSSPCTFSRDEHLAHFLQLTGNAYPLQHQCLSTATPMLNHCNTNVYPL
jgi:hypothetical protein